jgi:hypothetical protein
MRQLMKSLQAVRLGLIREESRRGARGVLKPLSAIRLWQNVSHGPLPHGDSKEHDGGRHDNLRI